MSTVRRSNLSRPWIRRFLIMAPVVGGLALSAFVVWFYLLGPQPPDVTVTDEPGAALDITEAQARVKRWPFLASKWGRLGFVLREYDFEKEAIVCFARAAQLNPSDPRWPYLQSTVAVRSDLEAAQALLERSVQLNPPSLSPRLLLGETLLRLGRADEAQEHFQFVLDLEPENARALLGMGRAASEQGDLPKSLDYLKRSADKAGQVKMTHTLLAEIYARQGDQEHADSERNLASSLPASAKWHDPYRLLAGRPLRGQRLLIQRAASLNDQKQPKKALEILQEVDSKGVQAFRKQVLVGNAKFLLEDFAASEKAYREALKIHPDRVEVLIGLAKSLLKQNKVAEAEECSRKVIELKADSAEGHFQLGRCLDRQDSIAEAIAEYRETVRLRPGFAFAHKSLGALLEMNGQESEAAAAFETACKLEPNDADAKKRLSELRERIGAIEAEDKSP